MKEGIQLSENRHSGLPSFLCGGILKKRSGACPLKLNEIKQIMEKVFENRNFFNQGNFHFFIGICHNLPTSYVYYT